jgi:hypothetical protein
MIQFADVVAMCDAGWTPVMKPEQLTRLRRYRDCHFKGKTTKQWSKKEYEAEIEEIKEKLVPLRLGILH